MAPRNKIKSEKLSDDCFISIVENKLKINRDQFKLINPLLSEPIKNGSVSFLSLKTEIKIEHNDGRQESVHAVVKTLLETSEFNKEIKVFAREKMMYEDLISCFQKIWEEVGVEDIILQEFLKKIASFISMTLLKKKKERIKK